VAVVAQRDGVRVIAFQKCGHTSIINAFLTPLDAEVQRGIPGVPLIRNSGDEAAAIGAYRGDVVAAHSWPKPELTIAFFRNPLARALSAYEHFFVRGTLRTQFEELGFKLSMEFPDFALHLRNIDLNADPHLRPQTTSYMAAGLHDNIYAGQLEQIDVTWPLLVDQHNLDCSKQMPRYNAATYETEDRLTGARLLLFEDLYKDDYLLWRAAHFEAGATVSSVCH
jgi:hypothetical protein